MKVNNSSYYLSCYIIHTNKTLRLIIINRNREYEIVTESVSISTNSNLLTSIIATVGDYL